MKKKARKVAAQPVSWEKLTWDDLLEWTDSRSLERGRSYQRRGAVRNLNLLSDGGLLADVWGTHQYATHVWMAGGSRGLINRLEAMCSCPIGSRCKHGVAVILQYLDAIENDRQVPDADDNDPRLILIERGWEDEYLDGESKDEEFDGVDSGGADYALMEEEDKLTTRTSRSRKEKSPGKKTRAKRTITDTDIAEFLTAKRKDDLVRIIMQFCRDDAKLRRTYVDRIMLETGDHAAMIDEAWKELRSVTTEEAWYDPWEGHGNLPDYSRLRSQFRSLVDAEQFDAVIELGRELIQRGIRQVGESHDDGETTGEIMSALSIVAEAIESCTLSDVDKILYVIDAFLQDDYDICDSFHAVLDRSFPRATWAEVAENLKSRLPFQEANRKNRESADFVKTYRRERLSGWVIDALEASGDEEAATDFCIEEARNAGSYQRAVDRLIALKRYDDANDLAMQGLQDTEPTSRGLINRLQDSLATIAAQRKDYSVASAIAADRFVGSPGVSSFNELLRTAKKAKCEAATKAVAMHFLETGKPPAFAKAAATRSNKPKKAAKPRTDCWPFPTPPGAVDKNARSDRGDATKPSLHFDVLIRLSIQQRDPESVLRWYDQWLASTAKSRFRTDYFKTEVADAVSSTHPDRAVELYCAEADRLAAATNVRLYPQAVSLLKKAREVLKSNERGQEFEAILKDFHNDHQRKRRLVELLQGLGGRPIVSKRRGRR